MEHYFCRSNYWEVDGHLFFSIYEPSDLVQALGGAETFREILTETQRRLARNGLPPLHLNAIVRGDSGVAALKEAGYESTTRYNIHDSGRANDDLMDQYEDLIEAHRKFWARMSRTSLPHFPVVTMGWDVTPRRAVRQTFRGPSLSPH